VSGTLPTLFPLRSVPPPSATMSLADLRETPMNSVRVVTTVTATP
jgi:hypothetical protein